MYWPAASSKAKPPSLLSEWSRTAQEILLGRPCFPNPKPKYRKVNPAARIHRAQTHPDLCPHPNFPSWAGLQRNSSSEDSHFSKPPVSVKSLQGHLKIRTQIHCFWSNYTGFVLSFPGAHSNSWPNWIATWCKTETQHTAAPPFPGSASQAQVAVS